MKIIGLTGGSGSGKTSVSALFAKLGADIIDTDVIAHEVVQKGMQCLDELTEHFGKTILNIDGTLNRKKLASVAFSNDESREALNRITHAHIKKKVTERIEKSTSDVVVIDGAVIIGSEIEPLCDFIVSVLAKRSVRIERIKKRDALTDEEALRRLSAQPNDEFYKKNSLYIIYNNGSAEELEERACELYKKIKEVSF